MNSLITGEVNTIRIYLDNCTYNRPYDDLSQITVNLEAQAKLHIQAAIRKGRYELVSSEILMKEIDDCPVEIRKKGIESFVLENSSIHVGPANTHKIDEMARDIMKTGVKYKDASHIASALFAGCAYLISTDKRLLKYQNEKIKLVTPIEFITEMEAEDGD